MASSDTEVAIIGIAVNLPGASDCNEFWKLLLEGRDTVGSFPASRAKGVQHVMSAFKDNLADPEHPFFTGSFFDEVDKFDNEFFNVSHEEAVNIEPEQRMFLELTYKLMEDAGYAGNLKGADIGVYVGNSRNKYQYILTENHPSISHGNHPPFIASRVSYVHDLKGPAMMVATGCSSSLLAVHLACQGLISGDCQMAIAGGITIDVLPVAAKTDIWTQLGITGQGIKCRAFDDDAKGIAKGEGAGVVLLKPLAKAVQDGDFIYGVLSATAANNDGHSQGITAPHPLAQSRLLKRAWSLANIDPARLGYFEAHGTGTYLGDPIELSAIKNAFKDFSSEVSDLKIPMGSVKANIGHLADGAAGIIGLIKVLLCFQHNKIPKQINFNIPNKFIKWEDVPCEIITSTKEWIPSANRSRLAGVSSFGLLGTNVHCILRDYKIEKRKSCPAQSMYHLPIYGRDKDAIKSLGQQIASYLKENPTCSLYDLCGTLEKRDSSMQRSKVVSGSNCEEIVSSLVDMTFSEEDDDKAKVEKRCPEANHIPMLPTYCFERKSFWPSGGDLTFKGQLALEHGTVIHNEKGSSFEAAGNIEESVSKILDDIFLPQQCDWRGAHQFTNLFELGIDSLIVTKILAKCHSILGDHIKFSPKDFYENPTYNGIVSLLKRNIDKDIVDSKNQNISTVAHWCDDVNKTYPLSSAQKRLWVTNELCSNKATYNITDGFWIKGKDFSPEKFIKAVELELERHSAFVTKFLINEEKEVVQQHCWGMKIKVKRQNFNDMQRHDAEMKIKSLYLQDYTSVFDLYGSQPLIRCNLYSVSDEEYFFTLVAHHIIFDGRSHFVLNEAIWKNYVEEANKNALENPSNGELAILEASRVSDMNSHIEFWREKLDGAPQICTFPGDKRRPHIFSYFGRRKTTFLSEELVTQIEDMAKRRKTTTFKILTTVLSILLQKYSNSEDIVVGTPVSGRMTPDMMQKIGLFVNTIVLRVSIESEKSFKSILEDVGSTFTEALEHQDLPFDYVVQELVSNRVLSANQLFNVNICYHNKESVQDKYPKNLTVTRDLIHNNTAKWDTYFDFLVEDDGQMRFTLEYYSELYSDKYAENIAADFLTLLSECIKSPEVAVQDFLRERPSIIRGKSEVDGFPTIAEALFEKFKNSEWSCLQDADGHFYSSLGVGERSKIMANFLREKCGLVHQDSVAILCDPSKEAIESIIACSMGGMKYIPLNPASPKSRLAETIKGCKIKVVLCSSDYTNIAYHLYSAMLSITHIICIDDNTDALNALTLDSPLMNQSLWNSVASEAEDEIQGGGWKNSYNGKHFSVEEMEEYADNVLSKLHPFLKNDCTILEVGCGSGITTKKLIPFAKQYIATDMSEEMVKSVKMDIERNAESKSNSHVSCMQCSAHDIMDRFQGQKFDVIVMNSVVHCFPDLPYLERVILMCEKLLNEDGILFVGDIMDLEKKKNLILSLQEYKARFHHKRTKIDWSHETFLSKKFLHAVCDASSFQIVDLSKKNHTISNELTRYRFDMICRKSSLPSFQPKHFHYSMLDVNNFAKVLPACIEENVAEYVREVKPEDFVYAIFTSGSTGNPKCINISHQNLMNYTTWARNQYLLTENDTIALYSPLTFDFTVTCIFPPLLVGALIKMFNRFCNSYSEIATCPEITTMKVTPLQLQHILDATDGKLSVKKIIIGGEQLSNELLEALAPRISSDSDIWNEYGPTEATVGCIAKKYKAEDIPLQKGNLVSIGLPMSNTCAIVMNEKDFLPKPIGCKGRIALSGLSVSYEETRGDIYSFPDEYQFTPGAQFLLTDDEGIVINNELVHLGRTKQSNVVKVRGVRIDKTEIVSALNSHPQVINSWVHQHDKNELSAAIVTNKKFGEENNVVGTIKKFLEQSLPMQMIPNRITVLNSFPITKHGKLDETKLVRLTALSHTPKETGELDPDCEDELFSLLKKLWYESLPIDQTPHLTEDFFYDLSGDSLQAILLVRKLHAAGYDKVKVADIFKYPTIETLALHINSTTEEENPSNAIVYNETTDSKTTFTPTPIIIDFVSRNPSGRGDSFALNALLRFSSDPRGMIEFALESVIKKHQSLHSKFVVQDDGKVKQIVRGEITTSSNDALTIDLIDDVDEIYRSNEFYEFVKNTENQLSLEQGRVFLPRIIIHSKCQSNKIIEANNEKKFYLLLVAHHVTVDIVSWEQIIEDIAMFMQRSSDGLHKNTSVPRTSFSTYCEHLYDESMYNEQIAYWRGIDEKVCDIGKTLSDHKQDDLGDALWVTTKIENAMLEKLSKIYECTQEVIVLSCLGNALTKAGNKREMAVCMESNGRNLENLHTIDTVGWCTARYPFIFENTSVPPAEAFYKMKEQLKSVPLRGVAYEALRETGRLEKRPLPEIMLVFQGSVDVAAKAKHGSGNMTFEHVQWLDVLKHHLRSNDIQRNASLAIGFPLAIETWLHGGDLVVGCLVAEESSTSTFADKLLSNVREELKLLHEQVPLSKRSMCLLSNISIPPDFQDAFHRSLRHHNIMIKQSGEPSNLDDIQKLEELSSVSSNHDTILVVANVMNYTDLIKLQSIESLSNTGKEVFVIILTTTEFSQKYLQKPQHIRHSLQILVDEWISKETAVEYLMPLTREGYLKTGQLAARFVRQVIKDSHYKVICVDCDNTLWSGECASGECVEIKRSNKKLQEYLLRKKEEGFLLAIISKNNLHDVLHVFQTNKDMVLSISDFVDVQVNWDEKVLNIEKISKSLNLALDSFVFMDDSIYECEKMAQSAPEVLTILVPPTEEDVRALLDELWILDKMVKSTEAEKRSQYYKEEKLRKSTLEDHQPVNYLNTLKSWCMEITTTVSNIRKVRQTSIGKRITELLLRTNQFKLNNFHLSLDSLDSDTCCAIFQLKDKFGDYGIISTLLFTQSDGTTPLILQWVISCRALGRGIEECILQEMKRVTGSGTITFAVNNTGKNTPAIKALQSISTNFDVENELDLKTLVFCGSKGKDIISVTVVPLHEMKYKEHANTADLLPHTKNLHETQIRESKKELTAHWSEILKDQRKRHFLYPLFETTHNKFDDDKTFSSLWRSSLDFAKDPVSEDDYFDCGGTSFSAVYFISELNREFTVDLELVDLLKHPKYEEFEQVFNEKVKSRKMIIPDYKDPREDVPSITRAQQRMAMMQLCDPLSTAYTEVVFEQVNKSFTENDIIAYLEKSHPILTTTIKESETEMNSFILSRDSSIASIDCGIVESLTFEEAVIWVSQNRPSMKLLESSLATLALLPLKSGARLVALYVHHIICDSATLRNIKGTMSCFSSDTLTNDYSVPILESKKESQYLCSDEYQQDLLFWRKIFEKKPSPPQWFLQRDASIFTFTFDLDLESNMTLEMGHISEFQYFLSLFMVLFRRYMGTNDITVAVPVSTRTPGDLSDGLGVNTVLFRQLIDVNMTLKDTINEIGNNWKTTQSHLHCPVDDVAGIIRDQHGMSLNNLCQVMINYEVVNEVNPVCPSKHSKMPLSVDILKDLSSGKHSIRIEWCLNENQKFGEYIASALKNLMTSVAEDSKILIKDLVVLSHNELEAIKTWEGNVEKTSNEYFNVVSLFENHASLFPDRIAVITDEISYSYNELEKLSTAYANQIRLLDDFDQEKPVILLVDKNQVSSVALCLAVWKSGGFFMLTNETNLEVLDSIAKDINACLIITDTSLEKQKRLLSNIKIHLVTKLNPESEKRVLQRSPSSVAYVVRTSGSTGKPKACKISHHNLVQMSKAWQTIYCIDNDRVACVLQWARISFDVAIGDITRALLCAPGSLVLCDSVLMMDPREVFDKLMKNKVTHFETTPQFAKLLLDLPMHNIQSLKYFILGSDILHPSLYKIARRELDPNVSVVNSYGMTEATIDSCCYSGEVIGTLSGNIPIGKPLKGVRIQILEKDTHLPCPLGVIGNIYISGPILNEGNDIVSLNTQERVLNTGDSGLWLSTGDIDLIGRVDSIKKIRGLRVNLLEVENHIRRIPHITDACVVIKENLMKEEILSAFIILDTVTNYDLFLKELKATLMLNLPTYMVPSLFEIVKSFPLNANGKLCRNALISVSKQDLSNNQSLQWTKQTNLRKKIVNCVRNFIGYDNEIEIDLEKSFMEQGLHSLALVRLAMELSKELQTKISIADLFSYPSITTLEKHIDCRGEINTSDSIIQTESPERAKLYPTIPNIKDENKDNLFAITGVAFRLPKDIRNLADLHESLSSYEHLSAPFPKSRLKDIEGSILDAELKSYGAYEGVFFDEIDLFDDRYFNIPSLEADYMPPEHRVMLEVGTEALLDANNAENVRGNRIGVFIGSPDCQYHSLHNDDSAVSIQGTIPGMLATRLAYFWDLTGPTMLVNTACSSSLVALHQATQELKEKKMSGALVGGVNLILNPSRKNVFRQNSISATDFKCRPFDKDAKGTVAGEGVICFYLESLDQAINQKKKIYSIIRGSSINNCGRSNGITSPNPRAQNEVYKAALSESGVQASDVDYVEAHGTGTKIGDQIEIEGLKAVFDTHGRSTRVPIVSSKGKFGHLDSAAGLLGVLSVIASFEKRQVYPVFNHNNPHEAISGSKLFVPTSSIEMPSSKEIIAGVSAFGLTGTNCHVIFQSANKHNQAICGKEHISPNLFDNRKRHWLPVICNKVWDDTSCDILMEKKIKDCQEMIRHIPVAPPAELEKIQIDFCCAIILKFFENSNFQIDKVMDFDTAFSWTNIHERYRKLFFVMMRELKSGGYVESLGSDESMLCLEKIRFIKKKARASPVELSQMAAQRFPQWADCFEFPLYCSQYLHEVLCKDMSPLSVIYPKGDMQFMYTYTRLGDVLGDIYYNLYIQVIAEYANAASAKISSKSLRLLEVGAGVGHVTKQLLSKVGDNDRIEYWFTDLGKSFVEAAAKRFSKYPNVKYHTFDITKNSKDQGLMGTFDIIVAYNVIHTTESVQLSVENLKSCLSENGFMFIIESSRNETWATLAWGVLDGWWYFKDHDIRPYDPMLEPSQWEDVISRSGMFVKSFPMKQEERQHVEKFLYLCGQKPFEQEMTTSTTWWENQDNIATEFNDQKSLYTQGFEINNRETLHGVLRDIWSYLLGVDNIEKEATFNELGGESLLVIQMIQEVRNRIGYSLEIADTYCYPSLGQLADFLSDMIFKKHDSVANDKVRKDKQISKEIYLNDHSDDEKRILLFPGQGSQKKGMCSSIADTSACLEVFGKAKEVLGFDILEKLRDDDKLEQYLSSTAFIQVALFVGCLAKVECLKEEEEKLMDSFGYVAGLSAGEFAALVYAGVLEFGDALHLIYNRGKIMEEEVQKNPTGMVSVFGPGIGDVEILLQKHFPTMEVGTRLADNQCTVVGTAEECQKFQVRRFIINSCNFSVSNVFKIRRELRNLIQT